MPRIVLTVSKFDINTKMFKLQLRKSMKIASEIAAYAFLDSVDENTPVLFGVSKGGFEVLNDLLAKKINMSYGRTSNSVSRAKTFKQGAMRLPRVPSSGKRLSRAKMLWRDQRFGFEFNHGVNYFHENETDNTRANATRQTPWHIIPEAASAAQMALINNLGALIPDLNAVSVKTNITVGRAGGITTKRETGPYFRSSSLRVRVSDVDTVLGSDTPF